MDSKMLELYADFAVRTAVNVQEGQTLIINGPLEVADFVRMCAQKGFEAGARDVVVHYGDEKMSRLRMQHADVAVLEDIKPWRLQSYMDYARPGEACVLSISASDPELYKGLDSGKVDRANLAMSEAMRPWRELAMNNDIQWTVLSVPTEAWARKVLPELPVDAAQERLWQAIFQMCRVDTGDPVNAWKQHSALAKKRADALNDMRLQALHLKSANGTDLTIGLAEDYLFAGIQELSTGGVPFLANIPSEEIFTAPHHSRVEGVVKSSLPYVYNGNLIEGITARFVGGEAVEVTAEKGEDLMRQMMSADAGARHLGEIALVPASSPVRQTGLLFYNTLFDENAACHMAFGAGYPGTVRGGTAMSRDELAAKGMNDSMIHEDVMIGTPDMDIDGILPNGERVPVFRAGEWVLAV